MMRKITKRVAFRTAAVGSMSLLVAAAIAPGAMASGDVTGNVKVSNTETVQVLMDASAKIDAQRVYEQLVLTGNGKVDIANPVSTDGLRNLDGFGGYDVRDGKVRIKTDVSGTKKYRSVSNFTKKLPLDISIKYVLDGKEVKPGDVVGKSGKLEVRYRVTNNTGTMQDVPFTDGHGVSKTAPESVVIPMVGSLTTVLPSTFTKVQSAEANAAGDGRGGTQLSFTMTLFPPIGKNFADFGYTAEIKDGVIPSASMSALPLNPLESPSFSGGAASYKSGAETGADLTAGATEIDANLLKLRDGGNDLVAGLLKLQAGAGQLSAGLNNDAAPGARKLAAGAGALNAGASQLRSGTRDLADGTKQLKDGIAPLSGGLKEAASKAPGVPDGFGQIKAGLDGVEAGLKTLLDDAVNPAIQGLGTTSPGLSVLYAVTAVRTGLADAKTQLDASIGDLPASQASLNCAGLILADITGGAQAPGACFPPGNVRPPTLTADVDPTRHAVLSQMSSQLVSGAADIGGMKTALDGLSTGLGDAVTNLYKAACGLDFNSNPGICDPTKPGILQALLGIRGGIGSQDDGFTGAKPNSLRTGVKALRDGAAGGEISSQELVDGLLQMNAGVNIGSAKSPSLVDGLGALDAGAKKLNAGAGTLKDGTGQLSAGAGTLADGLGTAAAGSGQLADGLNQAADGAPAIPDGAQKLSTEGTSKLIEAGDQTASDYGLKYAVIEAGAERASSAQPYGSPEGATALTAYKFEIAGADGAGAANAKRGLAAIVLLAGAAAATMIRRKATS